VLELASDKLRPGASDNVDVFLYVAGGRRQVVYLFAEETGRQWSPAGALAPGPNQAQRWCAPIPSRVRSAEPLRIEQVVYYPGLAGLWSIRSPLPDLVVSRE
jgi:hypothetical protein